MFCDYTTVLIIDVKNLVTPYQGRSDGGGGIWVFNPPPKKKKSAQVNFLWGKNDVRAAIQQF